MPRIKKEPAPVIQEAIPLSAHEWAELALTRLYLRRDGTVNQGQLQRMAALYTEYLHGIDIETVQGRAE